MSEPGDRPRRVANDAEARRRRRPWAGLGAILLRAVGVVATLLIVNYALGAAWDAARGNDADYPPAASADRLNLVGDSGVDANGAAIVPNDLPPDQRQFKPPMSNYPWSGRYYHDLQRLPVLYWPYNAQVNGDFRSPYINQTNGIRVSYEPASLPARHPVVAFYGGSTMWGEGQRDRYTIASYIARLAEADGWPVEVVNHGIRGVASWDEAIVFENDLAAEPAPDVAVFYDGFNDCALAQEAEHYGVGGQPWEYTVDDLRARLQTFDPSSSDPHRPGPGLWEPYMRHSLVNRLYQRVRDRFSTSPAGASPTEAPPADQLDRDCASVYRRARVIFSSTAKAAGVDLSSFWQPVQNPVNGPAHYSDTTAALVGPPTVNLAHSLDDHRPTYIDGGHTDEVGAQVVAKAMYRTLGPKLAAWYRAHG